MVRMDGAGKEASFHAVQLYESNRQGDVDEAENRSTLVLLNTEEGDPLLLFLYLKSYLQVLM